ncbi:MAG: hypothetical protein R3F48_13615 [Candidatus Zixiibacteriota bacterium]
MRVGIDFDGVIADIQGFKKELAYALYGVNIQNEVIDRDKVIEEGYLTSNQYRHLQSMIYRNPITSRAIKPINGAIKYINKLHKRGYDIVIITSRGKTELQNVRHWLDSKKLNINLVGTNRNPDKSAACHNISVYVDDQLRKLEYLQEIVPHRFWFSSSENIIPSSSLVRQVNSWFNLYNEITKLDP